MGKIFGFLIVAIIIVYILCLAKSEILRQITIFIARRALIFMAILLVVSFFIWTVFNNEELGRPLMGFSFGCLILMGIAAWDAEKRKKKQGIDQREQHENPSIQSIMEEFSKLKKRRVKAVTKEEKTYPSNVITRYQTVNLYEVHSKLPEGYQFVELIKQFGRVYKPSGYTFVEFSIIKNDQEEYFLRKFTVFDSIDGVNCPYAIMMDGCDKIDYPNGNWKEATDNPHLPVLSLGEIMFVNARKKGYYDLEIADMIADMLQKGTITPLE